MKPPYKINDYIKDRYMVCDIKQGGMGWLYIAFDIAFDEVVAIKTTKNILEKSNSLYDNFINEAQLWILLEQHPHIVQAKSTFLIDKQPYIVIEYIAGGDLSQWITGKPHDLQIVLNYAIQFCNGAAYAYNKLSLIHRDIKPSNLLITKQGVLKITDFGLARVNERIQDRGTIAGTPFYMSPEQYMDSETTTKQSDIYSFGVTLYEMVTGELPFYGNTISELRKAHEHGIIKNPKDINSEIPDKLAAIICKCLDKNPTHRYLHYEDLADQLMLVYNEVTGNEYKDSITEKNDKKYYSQAELLNKGNSLYTIGSYKEALHYYDRLLELYPQSAHFWERKGNAIEKLGKYYEANLYYGHAMELEPSNENIAKSYINCLMHINKNEEALQNCNKVLIMNPDDIELLQLKRKLMTGSTISYEISKQYQQILQKSIDIKNTFNKNPNSSTTL